MIDKAFGLQEAVRNAVYNEGIRMLAGHIVFSHMEMTEDELKNAIFELIGTIASHASFETTLVLLDEDQQGELTNTIEMLQEMGNE